MATTSFVIDSLLYFAKEHYILTIILLVTFSNFIINALKRPKSVKDDIVFITGAASGIGRQLAIKLAALGAKVIIADIDLAKAQQVASEISNKNQKAIAVHCDVCSVESVAKAAEIAKSSFGHPTILINNAGIVSGKSITELSILQIERTIKVNSISHFYTIKEFLPNMIKENKGHIVTIASSAGIFGVSKMTDYCASKFAAVGLDEALRNELKSIGSDVQTTCVCPYYIDTGMFEGVSLSMTFLLPLLKEDWITTRIVKAIRLNEKVLVAPSIIKRWLILRAFLPVEWTDKLEWLIGFQKSMDTFKGRGQ